jgi:hypothetical protein
VRKTFVIIALIGIFGISIGVTASAEEDLIPSWIKNTAGFWVDGQISDSEFIKALQFLVEKEILIIPQKEEQTMQGETLDVGEPFYPCINDLDTSYKIKAELELIVDGKKIEIPENFGISDEGCRLSLYTLGSDGTFYVEWVEEYPFEIGHFLWMWDFPLSDMDQSKSTIYVNGMESPYFINSPLVDGYHYKAVFVSKKFN